ncbi:sporulation protein YabP [Clostridium sp. D2Q-14]|uniref:sporulation protein YabP n=1 Tax=Anaeromonas gelatinilytica TaxID=2683194 RepID=UPI00193B1248|nr:sporulation protein YabP [Anaeromonas gelatinilytica]MBS4534688.1 sporulation protein YabP [Anaeromonas gelatinilytica]
MEDKVKSQNLILEDRKKLSISGVEHVENFNEEQIVLDTVEGSLMIKGESLNISKLNLEDGNVKIEGMLQSLVYSNKSTSNSKENGFLRKIFK